MGERTVREIVYSTCDAIWRKLQPICMPTPDEAMWIQIEKEFCDKWNFPNLIGALDGKHVQIEAPPHSGSQFFCYKKFFSVVLLSLVDSNCKFIAVDVGGFGKNSDGSIFNNSNLGLALRNNELNIPNCKPLPGTNCILPHVIVGDEAFPLRTYLMRPYPREQAQGNEDKKVFNYRLSRARNVSENAFGILVRKFRVFEHRMSMSYEHVNAVILAACCLHNFLRDDACHWTEKDLQVSVSDIENLQNLQGTGGNASHDALTEINLRITLIHQ